MRTRWIPLIFLVVHLKHVSPNKFYMYRLHWSTVAYWDFVPSKMSDFHKILFLTVKSSIVPTFNTPQILQREGIEDKNFDIFTRGIGKLQLLRQGRAAGSILSSSTPCRKSAGPEHWIRRTLSNVGILISSNPLFYWLKQFFYLNFIIEIQPLFASWIKHNGK